MTIDSAPISKAAIYDDVNNTVKIPSVVTSGSVELTLPSNTRSSRIIKCGVPLPSGAVSSTDELILKDENGTKVDAEFTITVYWPNGSFKWVLITANVASDPTSDKLYSLDYGAGVSNTVSSSNLGYTENATQLIVSTGKSRVTISKVTGLIESAYADTAGDLSYATQVLGQAVIYTQDGLTDDLYDSSYETNATVTVARSGPFQLAVSVRGHLKDATNTDYTEYSIHYYFYKDVENFDIEYSMIDDQPVTTAQTNFSIIDYATATPTQTVVPFSARNLRIEFPHLITSSPQYIFGGSEDGTVANSTGSLTTETYLFQSGIHYLQKPSIYSQTLGIESERGYSDGQEQVFSGVAAGDRAKGFGTVHNGVAGVSVIMKNFWKEWPNEINADTSKITMHLHPERYVNGTPLNYFDVDGDYWKDPNGLFCTRRGMSKTFELTICIHSGTPSQSEIEGILSDRNNHQLQLRASSQHYCDTGIWRGIQPQDADSSTYYDGMYNNTFLYSATQFPARNEITGWREYGSVLRPDAEASSFDKSLQRSGNYKGNHFGSHMYVILNIVTGEPDWLDWAFREANFYMDQCIAHGGYDNSYGAIDPLPAGVVRIGSHRDVVLDCGFPDGNHTHVSCLPDYWGFTGSLRTKECLLEIKDYLTHIADWYFYVPFPETNTSGSRQRAVGTRHLWSTERNWAWIAWSGIMVSSALGDYDMHETVCTQTVNHMLQWWQYPEDHYVGGVNLGSADYQQGTGYWLNLAGTDNTGGYGYTNSPAVFQSGGPFQFLLDWYDQELLLGTTTVDLQSVRDMMYQTCNFIFTHAYVENLNGFLYTCATPPTAIDINGARNLLSSFARIYNLYQADLAASNITNPEWYNTALWKSAILYHLNLWRTYDRGLYPYIFFGYELPWPLTFWKDAIAIEAE